MSNGNRDENDVSNNSVGRQASRQLLGESIGLAVVLLLSLGAMLAGRVGLIPFGDYLSSLMLLLGSLAYLKLFRASAIPERSNAFAVRPRFGVSKLDLAMLVCGLALLALVAWVPLARRSVSDPDPILGAHLLLLVPISEELYFRGLLLNHLQRGFGASWAVLFSSVLFMLLHQGVGAMIVAGVLAVLACLLVFKSGALGLAVQLHVLWNGLTYVNRIQDESMRWGYAGVAAGIIVSLFVAKVLFLVQSRRSGQ